MAHLVEELLRCPEVRQVYVTLNIPELIELPSADRLIVKENINPAGFATNHNAAFAECKTQFFCSMNPDVKLQDNLFPHLLKVLESMDASIIAPMVINCRGDVEDSARYFPTFSSLLMKAFFGVKRRYLIEENDTCFCVHWLAGMFHLFRSSDFKRLHGYDPDFFLYYEDVDICMRAWKVGMKVVACPTAVVIHDAQRASRRNIKYLRWHLLSMTRYFLKHRGIDRHWKNL